MVIEETPQTATPPGQLAKLWCTQCGDYTRHSRQAGTATCLACGHRHTAILAASAAPKSRPAQPPAAPQQAGSGLMWRRPASPELEKNYRFVHSEAKLLLERTRQLNHFLKQYNIPAKPLAESEVQRLIGELDRLLEENREKL